ncbi:MAG: transglycosylase SLT domain-containing protein [Acidobacteriaceae bacterium]|nr:transglycosylase SLT domain-containing protein [Acidobacteriaceae bacterium]
MVFQRLSAALVLLSTGLLFSAQPRTAAQQLSAADKQRDRQLIQNVENAYQNGLSNYRDGHLAAAKSNFDYAVDLMLSSGIDLNTDSELKDELDRIVDAVNTLEMDALKSGAGLAEPAEPTPVDVANAATLTVDPTIRAQAEAALKSTQSDIPLVINDYVASYINFFLKSRAGHATIVASLNRAGRYKEMIERILKEEGVPQDLIYQAVAESGFRPQAVNPRSGAGGMWQFMPYGTYGLERTGWYDERFDPEKATRAYANEMKKAYNQLGDWYLAMAAYDWGTGNIQRAVQRTGYADFWELYRRNNLPTETKNYVPIILAVTILAKNPKQYGLDDLTPDPPLLTDTVRTNYSVDLRLVADLTGVPVQEIVGLNPSLLRGATPPDEEYDLHLPVGTKELFEKRIAEIPEDKRRYWRYHNLAEGESITDIARMYHVSASEIAFVNQLGSADDLSGVDALVIPVAPASSPSSARNAMYRARRGDTLVTVADRFGVTVDQLKRWNHLRTTALTPGHSLYVAEPARIPEGSRKGRKGSSATHGSSSHHNTTAQGSQHSAKTKATVGTQTVRRTSASITPKH